jgi:hypothetical protein
MFTFTFTFATMSCLASVSTFAQILYLSSCSPISAVTSLSAQLSVKSTSHISLQLNLLPSSQIKDSIQSINLTITNHASPASIQARLLGACVVLLHHIHPTTPALSQHLLPSLQRLQPRRQLSLPLPLTERLSSIAKRSSRGNRGQASEEQA